ncbi:MAG: response regulator [Rhodocyclales bacterium]|nr:response regulator [Rhodocyclales bacterium]
MTMTKQTLKVFVVDDDPSARMIALFQMEHLDVDVHEFPDGASCLAALGEAPDIVILDVEMPGTGGIDVCRAIRTEGNAGAQIIFVSARDDLETRLAAYDAGGNDYIVKPYAAEELGRKIGIATRAIQLACTANEQAQFAHQTAFTAMSSLAEMGVTQDFLRASFNCQTPDELGRAVCGALEQYGLQGLVELRDETNSHCVSSRGPCTALEISLLGHAQSLERIFQFRDRLAINYRHATLLISGLPLSDADRMGRFRDHLVMLAEGAEARFLSMQNEARRLAQAQEVIAAVADLTATLEEIERHQEDHRVQVLLIANDQLQSLTRAFVHLGLSQGQEEELVSLTQHGIDRISHLQDYSNSTSQRLREATTRLKRVTGGD